MQVTAEHVDAMRFSAMGGGHTVVVDAVPEHGGGGTAMSPPLLFAAAVLQPTPLPISQPHCLSQVPTVDCE